MARSKRRVLLQRQNALETQLAETKRALAETDRQAATRRLIVLGESILARARNDLDDARSEVQAILAGPMRPHDRFAFEDWSPPWEDAVPTESQSEASAPGSPTRGDGASTPAQSPAGSNEAGVRSAPKAEEPAPPPDGARSFRRVHRG